jgi:hypothetical protein
VDNNYLDLGMNKSGFVHTLPVAGLRVRDGVNAVSRMAFSLLLPRSWRAILEGCRRSRGGAAIIGSLSRETLQRAHITGASPWDPFFTPVW